MPAATEISVTSCALFGRGGLGSHQSSAPNLVRRLTFSDQHHHGEGEERDGKLCRRSILARLSCMVEFPSRSLRRLWSSLWCCRLELARGSHWQLGDVRLETRVCVLLHSNVKNVVVQECGQVDVGRLLAGTRAEQRKPGRMRCTVLEYPETWTNPGNQKMAMAPAGIGTFSGAKAGATFKKQCNAKA